MNLIAAISFNVCAKQIDWFDGVCDTAKIAVFMYCYSLLGQQNVTFHSDLYCCVLKNMLVSIACSTKQMQIATLLQLP